MHDPGWDGRPTARYAGTNSERQSVGLPGHCADCAMRGHVAAHPDLGCGDVGCTSAHDEDPPPTVTRDQHLAARTLVNAADSFREYERGGYLFLNGSHERVPWEAVATALEDRARAILAGRLTVSETPVCGL